MAILNQPKWRNFLSLKGEPKVKNVETPPIENGKAKKQEANIANKASQPTAAATPQKRKRTEEEIAQRKAKKLKSKGKQTQEWQKLAELQVQQSVEENESDKTTNGNSVEESGKSRDTADTIPTEPQLNEDNDLLSKKAKEISKARREEKIQDRQQQLQKKKKSEDQLNVDRKANQVLEYLDEYGRHVDTGSEWKFKKQYQNWIVKHLYDYSWKDDGLLIRYLKTAQGGVRERLLIDAKEMIKSAEEKGDTSDAKQMAQNVIQALEG